MEGNLRFKIDWASLTVGSKFTVFALFYFVFEGNFQVQSPGGLIFGGVFSVTSFGGLYLEGLIHGGAYFRNFTVSKKENIYGVNKTPKNPKKRKRYTTISKNVVGRKAKSLSQD